MKSTVPSARSGRDPATLYDAEAWVFDLDNTLYPATFDLFGQIDDRMRAYIARFLGVGLEEAYRLQKHYFREYGTSLHGLMHRHGMDPLPFLDFVPLDNRIAIRSRRLPGTLHPDPADRIIVATTLSLGATLITKDVRLRRYPHVDTLW